MKKAVLLFLGLLFSVSLIPSPCQGQEKKEVVISKPGQIDESLKREALAAIQRSVNFFTDKQKPDGSWCQHPAITGLVCMALNNSGAKELVGIRKAAVDKGREFILKYVQPDGSIWLAGREQEYPNYTTAICLATLAILNRPEDENVMRKARKYLIGSQFTEDNKDNPTKKDDPSYGGIGYGKTGRPDLSNTQWALEALYLTEYLDKEPQAKSPEDTKKADLAWKNAIMFLSRIQNLPESNDQAWVVKDKNDPSYADGGFIYKSDESKANEKLDDKKSLRSYGSMTYAGLKSMIYAKLKKDDPRVKAAIEWASKNYTLDENPGMGSEGLYYYIQTFSKAMSLLGDDTLKTSDGKEHPWRVDTVKKLLSMQKKDGEWANEKSSRWMECIPELVTAYTLLSLEAAMGPELYIGDK